jgi:hypothetical protein
MIQENNPLNPENREPSCATEEPEIMDFRTRISAAKTPPVAGFIGLGSQSASRPFVR